LKKLFTTILIVVLITALPIAVSYAQVPTEETKALLAGPVMVGDELAMQVGYSIQLQRMWINVMGKFGETTEAEVEIMKMFPLSNRVYVGLIAGGGVDWSDDPSTGGEPIEAILFGSVGLAGTVGLSDDIGVWGFWKGRDAKIKSKPKVGVGLYLKL